jgi:hypothetical protein
MGGKGSKDASSGVQARVNDIDGGAVGTAGDGRKLSRKEKSRSKKLAKQESKRLKAEKRTRSKSTAGKYAANGSSSLQQADADAQVTQRELNGNQGKSEAIRAKARANIEGGTKSPPSRPPPPSESVLQRAAMMAQDPATQWMQVEEHRSQSSGSITTGGVNVRPFLLLICPNGVPGWACA